MQHLAAQVFGGMAVVVGLIAWMGGPGDAARFADHAMSVIGVTAGAVVHGVPDLIDGFRATEDNADRPRTDRTNARG